MQNVVYNLVALQRMTYFRHHYWTISWWLLLWIGVTLNEVKLRWVVVSYLCCKIFKCLINLTSLSSASLSPSHVTLWIVALVEDERLYLLSSLLLPSFVGRFVAWFGPRRQSIRWDIDGLETWQKYTQNNNGWRQQGKRGPYKKKTTSEHPAVTPKQIRKSSAKFSTNVVSPSLPTNSDGDDSPPMRASMSSDNRW